MSQPFQAVFLSYAREDAKAARRIAEALRSQEIEVWFDEDELRGGEAWDAKIRKQINDCTLFLALVSRNTQARSKGYFRLEWKLAVEQTHLMLEGVPFLAPVAIDETVEAGAAVPAEFLRVQWTRLPGALPTPQFVEQIKRLLGSTSAAPMAEDRGHALAPTQVAHGGRRTSSFANAAEDREDGGRTSKAARPSYSKWVMAGVAVVLGVGGYVAFRPQANVSPVAASSPAARPPTEFAAANAADKSIAVLPFANLSDDRENTDFFADGIHEDILTNLANIRELRVISRTSVLGYRGTTKKIPEIARELDVAYILEGSVRRAGSQVRITAQLIRAANDEHLWARSYDRELTPKDVFAIQALLSTEIARALEAAISPETRKLLERRPTENLAAYELYLRARPLSTVYRSPLAERTRLLQEAVALDPNFAEAWGELADSHSAHIFQNIENTPDRLAQADAAIARALRLAPDAPEVLRLMGTYAYQAYRDYARATAQFEKVLQLQPNYASAFLYLGAVQRRQGRWLESMANMRKATQLDRANVNFSTALAGSLLAGRRWQEAIAEFRRASQLRPDDLDLRRLLVICAFEATGSTREIDEWLAGLAPAQLESPQIVETRKFRAIVAGDFAGWKRLDAIQSNFDEDETPRWRHALDAATVLAGYGELDAARSRLGNHPAEIRAALEREPANDRLWIDLALMEALLGEKEAALRDAGKAVELMPETRDAWAGASLHGHLAKVLVWSGERDRAFAELAHLLRVPGSGVFGKYFGVHALRVDPAFFPLHDDPRFQALLDDPKNNAPLF